MHFKRCNYIKNKLHVKFDVMIIKIMAHYGFQGLKQPTTEPMIPTTQQTLDIITRAPTSIDYLNIWLFRILGVIGLILFYLANGGSKGNDFLSKFFTFSFTVGIKYYFLDIVLEYLPNYFPSLASNYYLISLTILINMIMATNIGLRIYQTKT